MQNGWGSSWYSGAALSEQVNALPATVDGVTPQDNGQNLQQLQAQATTQGQALQTNDNWLAAEQSATVGVAVGVGVTATVIVAAPLAVTAGAYAISGGAALGGTSVAWGTATAVSADFVSTGLTVAGVIGLGATAVDTYDNVSAGNWNAVAYDVGTLVGGFGVGGYAQLTAPRTPNVRPLPAFSDENWSNPELGNQMHDNFQNALADQTGTRPQDWQMNTNPNRPGIDANWANPDLQPPGMDSAELKPFTQNGWDEFQTQMDNWYNNGKFQDGNTIQLFGYDQQGNTTSSGWNFTRVGDTIIPSIAPGYGVPTETTLVPNALWGGVPGVFGSTTNLSQGSNNRGNTCWGGIGQ